MKKILAVFLCFIFIVPNYITYAEDKNDLTYDKQSLQKVIDLYEYNKDEFELLKNRTALSYLASCDDYKEHTRKKWAIDWASSFTENNLDIDDYVVLLTQIIELNQYKLSDQVAKQSHYSCLKNFGEIRFDMIDVLDEFISDGNILSTAVKIASVGKDTIINTYDNLQYYEAISKNYYDSYCLLNAVYENATIDELKEAAKKLLEVNDTLFGAQMEFINSEAEDISSIEAEFFVKELGIPLLKKTEEYSKNSLVKNVVDKTESFVDQIIKPGKFVYKSMMIIGNYGFGTSGQFSCYERILALGDIFNSLEIECNKIIIDARDDLSSQYQAIIMKCTWLNWLIATDAAGEYYQYLILSDENNLLSNLDYIIKMIQNKETYDDWYNSQIKVLEKIERHVDEITKYNVYSVESNSLYDNSESNVVDEAYYMYGSKELIIYCSILNDKKNIPHLEIEYDISGDNIDGVDSDTIDFVYDSSTATYQQKVKSVNGKWYSISYISDNEKIGLERSDHTKIFSDIKMSRAKYYNTANSIIALKRYMKKKPEDTILTKDLYFPYNNIRSYTINFGYEIPIYSIKNNEIIYYAFITSDEFEQPGIAEIKDASTDEVLKTIDLNNYFDFKKE